MIVSGGYSLHPYRTLESAYSSTFPNGTMVLRLRADTGIDQDSSHNVNSWTDTLSDKGKSFSALVNADRPLWVPNAINGYPGVYFNGKTTTVPKMLIQASSYWSTTDFSNIMHLFLVGIIPTDPLPSEINYWFGNATQGTTTGQNFGVKHSSNAFFTANRLSYAKSDTSTVNRLISSTNIPLQQPFLVEFQVKGSQNATRIFLNGSDVGSTTLGSQGTSFTTTFRLGSTSNTATPQVIFSEVVLANQLFGDEILLNIRKYFNRRYSLGMSL